MPAVLDELSRWGVERFSTEALAERHLDAAMIYRYWGDRRQLIVDAALSLARNVTNRINTEVGCTLLRALVMDRRGGHDEATRLRFWRHISPPCARSWTGPGSGANCARASTPWLRFRSCWHRSTFVSCTPTFPVDDDYRAAIVDMAWHALARR